MNKEITLEEIIQNEVASAEMEGFTFEPEDIELIRQCMENKISYEEFLKLAVQDCME